MRYHAHIIKDTTPLERVPTGWPYVHPLTQREVMVMERVVQDHSYVEIAVALGITQATVGHHIHRIRIKLQVHGKVGQHSLLHTSLHARYNKAPQPKPERHACRPVLARRRRATEAQ